MTHSLGHFSATGIGIGAQCFSALCVEWRQQLARGKAFLVNGSSKGCPRRFLVGPDILFSFFADGGEFLFRGCAFLQKEHLHLANAIELHSPCKALFGFVTLVRSTGAVTLRLGDFLNVHEHRHVLFPAALGSLFVGGHQIGVIPALDSINEQTVGGLFPLES